MVILQVHQAKALKQVHEGRTDPGLMQDWPTSDERHSAVPREGDVHIVVQERHLWLNLATTPGSTPPLPPGPVHSLPVAVGALLRPLEWIHI